MITRTSDLSSLLDPPLIADDAEWLELNAPTYYKAIEAAVRSGKSAQAIYMHYMIAAPNRQSFWRRCKHAALYLIEAGDE